MAGDWIKMRTDLYRDPKVCVIADILIKPDSELSRYVSQNLQCDMSITRNVMRNVTVGALVAVWGVLRHRGKRIENDLFIKCCNKNVIDDLSEVQGFGEAMEFVGWVQETDEGIVLPNFFEEHNVDPSEELRRKNAERQRKFREKNKDKSNVTDNVTVTPNSNSREEKRREDINISFDTFWKTWPSSSRKASKSKCLEVWKRINPDEKVLEQIIKHVGAVIGPCDDNFRPAPLVYLNQRRWDGWEGSSVVDDQFAGVI